MNVRIRKLREALARDGVDGALFATSGSLQYLLDNKLLGWQRTPGTGGLVPSGPEQSAHLLNLPDCLLYVPAEDDPLLVVTHRRAKDVQDVGIGKHACFHVEMEGVLGDLVKGKRIAVGESCFLAIQRMVRSIDPSIEVLSGEGYVDELRKVKDASEIATLRKAALFTDDAMSRLIPYLRPGVTPGQIEGVLSSYARDAELCDLAFAPACICVRTGASGSESLYGHRKDQEIEEGTALAFDFGYVVDGYCSDFGRSFYCGKPEPLLVNAYGALQEAQLHLLRVLEPGMKMDVAQRTLSEVLDRYGFTKYLRDYGVPGLMGHQIGLDVHERPWLHDGAEEILVPGMVMCIEPKLWFPGKAYMRVEDMVLITGDGAESLTIFDRELFELPT